MAKTHTEVATVVANRFMVEFADRVRLTFGEAHADGDQYHQAVSLSRDDAMELAALIARLGFDPSPSVPAAVAETAVA